MCNHKLGSLYKFQILDSSAIKPELNPNTKEEPEVDYKHICLIVLFL